MKAADTRGLRRILSNVSTSQELRAKIDQNLSRFRKRSPVGALLERVFWGLQFLAIATWLAGTRTQAHLLPAEGLDESTRAKRVEFVLAGWAAVLATALVTVALVATEKHESLWFPFLGMRFQRMRFGWSAMFVVLAALRIIDIFQANVNAHLFDLLRIGGKQFVASKERSTLIAVWNYIELMGWFSILYFSIGWLTTGDKIDDATGLFDAVYFSVISQLTIGFGDLKPVGTLTRVLVMLQGCLGTGFIVFAIGRFASMLRSVDERDTP